MSNHKNLILIRGLSGSGKTTLANMLAPEWNTDTAHFEADDFFYDENGDYHFDRDQLSAAHEACQQNARQAMKEGCPLIVVSNTFSQRWEMRPYLRAANHENYSVQIVECQGSFGGRHQVPRTTVKRMRDRWEYPNMRTSISPLDNWYTYLEDFND